MAKIEKNVGSITFIVAYLKREKKKVDWGGGGRGEGREKLIK